MCRWPVMTPSGGLWRTSAPTSRSGRGATSSASTSCPSGSDRRGPHLARHFGTPPDVFEDPFTGSATGGMAAYLWRDGRLASPRFVAEQGHWMDRPGRAEVEVVGPPEAIETVRVGGPAVVVIRGELEI